MLDSSELVVALRNVSRFPLETRFRGLHLSLIYQTGRLCPAVLALQPANEADNPPAAFSQHWAEHEADQPEQTEPHGLRPVLASILSGELGFLSRSVF